MQDFNEAIMSIGVIQVTALLEYLDILHVYLYYPYSGLFSRGKIFTNFADWPQSENIFPLKLYRCTCMYG